MRAKRKEDRKRMNQESKYGAVHVQVLRWRVDGSMASPVRHALPRRCLRSWLPAARRHSCVPVYSVGTV